MQIWVEDLKYHFAMALRAVGIGLGAVAWASVLGSEAQQPADIRAYAQVGAAIVSVCIVQWLTALPPSATVVGLLRPLERDIAAAAREQTGAEPARSELLRARIVALAAMRIRRSANLPRDRRAWLRALASLAVLRARQDERTPEV